MADEKIKLGVLWKNLSRQGKKPYLSGRVQHENLDAAVQLLRDGGRLLVLSNTKRPNKQDPDCALFVVPEPRAQGGGKTDAAPSPSPTRPAQPASQRMKPAPRAAR